MHRTHSIWSVLFLNKFLILKLFFCYYSKFNSVLINIMHICQIGESHMVWIYFKIGYLSVTHSWVLVFIQSKNLWLLFRVLRLFIFNVILYVVGFNLSSYFFKFVLYVDYLKNDSISSPLLTSYTFFPVNGCSKVYKIHLYHSVPLNNIIY